MADRPPPDPHATLDPAPNPAADTATDLPGHVGRFAVRGSAHGRSPSALASSGTGVETFEHESTAAPAENRNGSRSNAAELRLTITDDGKGFVPHCVPVHGMGLRIMRYRAECIGAALRIESLPNRGTIVECRLTADHA